MKTTLFALLLTLTLSSAHATGKASFPKTGDMVKATTVVQLRASSPDPTFGVKGEQIGWLKNGALALVLSVKSYISIQGTEIWVEVAGKDDPALKGWVYAGLAQNMGQNAKLVAVPAELPNESTGPAAVRADDFVENESREKI